jgi:hypothetical protein
MWPKWTTNLYYFSCVFHDLSWATTNALISDEKRFEVDGANAACAWIREYQSDLSWDERQAQISWDAIALHGTPSISAHKEV